jgi:RNA polymerase sigma factor (sigma-70 family)
MRSEVDSLLARQLPALRAFIRLRSNAALRARESTSDLVQSVCRELCEDLTEQQVRDERGLRKWLFLKALDKVRDRYRYHLAQKRDMRLERSAPTTAPGPLDGTAYATLLTPSAIAASSEGIERIERAFDELPDLQREVLTLSRLVGLSRAEIAARLAITEKTVSNAIYRGLRRLSWILSDGARTGGADGP